MTSSIPGLPGAMRPATDDDLNKRLKTIEDTVAQLRQSLAAQTGMTFVDGAIRTNDFNGVLAPPAAGTAGWAVTDAGVGIFSALALANGIIGNDALTSPVAVAVVDGVASGFTPTSTFATRVTETVTVPAGFSTALVLAISIAGLSANAGGSFSSVRTVINNVAGDTISSQAGANIAMSVSSAQSAIIPALGATFDISTQSAGTSGGVVAASGNARIAATILFLR